MRLRHHLNTDLYKRIQQADKIGRDKPRVAISTRTVLPMVSWRDQSNIQIIAVKLKRMNELMRNNKL